MDINNKRDVEERRIMASVRATGDHVIITNSYRTVSVWWKRPFSLLLEAQQIRD